MDSKRHRPDIARHATPHALRTNGICRRIAAAPIQVGASLTPAAFRGHKAHGRRLSSSAGAEPSYSSGQPRTKLTHLDGAVSALRGPRGSAAAAPQPPQHGFTDVILSGSDNTDGALTRAPNLSPAEINRFRTLEKPLHNYKTGT